MAGGLDDFGPIIERYQDAVFGVALARLRNFHEAEDVAQEVFVTAFERLGGLKDPSRLGAWLRSVTIHRSIDRLRRRDEVVADTDGRERAASVSGPDVELERRELRDHVLAAISRLSKTQRETTTLFYVNGYSAAEVAAIQDVPVGRVRWRLHNARQKLKEEMIGMVENVLKSEAPREDFSQRVFELVDVHTGRARHWHEALAEIRKIGSEGMGGLAKALELPHWQTRRFAAQMLTSSELAGESVVTLLKQALNDSNKKVRTHAVHLLDLDVDEERKRTEFLPLLIPLLADRSTLVRRWAAWQLRAWAGDVPLAAATRALVNEQHGKTRLHLEWLVQAILAAPEVG